MSNLKTGFQHSNVLNCGFNKNLTNINNETNVDKLQISGKVNMNDVFASYNISSNIFAFWHL